MDNLIIHEIKFLEKTLFINNEILLELYFRFIAQIITHYYYLMK